MVFVLEIIKYELTSIFELSIILIWNVQVFMREKYNIIFGNGSGYFRRFAC